MERLESPRPSGVEDSMEGFGDSINNCEDYRVANCLCLDYSFHHIKLQSGLYGILLIIV